MKKRLSLFISALILSVICLFAFTANADEPKIIDTTNTVVSTYYEAYQFSGIEITPSVTVKYNGKKLVRDTDYTVFYEDNINVGTAKATVTGIGEYSGTVIKEYPIIPVSTTDELKISQQYTSVAYDGNAKTPSVTIKYRRDTLVNGIDYNITYSSNVNIGQAKITIKGIGNYSFTKTLYFNIVPAAVSGLKFTNETNAITLSWNKTTNVSGYQIVIYDSASKSYKSVKYVSASTTSYKITGLKPSTLYKYNVRGYRTIGDKTYYGVYTNDLLTRTRSAATELTYLAKNGSNITVKWKTVQGAGYVIRYATKSDFSNAKEIFINDSRTGSYTITKRDENAQYYVQVTPFTTLNGKKYYSARSAAWHTSYGKKLASFSSNYVNNANRTNNIIIASKAIDSTVVMPGQTFSFNRVVGQRTYAKGYKDAPVFTGGNKVENGVGGGICQVASTMFNTALYANVQIVERSQHSQRVSYVPLGRDAAISWGSQDFKWKNNTSYPIKIRITVANGQITCDFYTSSNVPSPNVNLSVTNNGNLFTLKRYSGGVCNYTTNSRY